MKTFICVNKSDGSHAGTWIGDGPPPAASERQFFVDRDDFPDFDVRDRLRDWIEDPDGQPVPLSGTLEKAAPLPAPPKTLSKFAFMDLLTAQERIALDARADTDAVLRDAMKQFERATHVECVPLHPMLGQMLESAETFGIMTTKRRIALEAAIAATAR